MSVTSRSLTLQNAAGATGVGAAIEVNGMGAVAFQITGTFVGTVTFQGTVDGANWVSLNADSATTGTAAVTATTTGIWIAPCAGLSQVRANITAWTSGNITVAGNAASSSFAKA